MDISEREELLKRFYELVKTLDVVSLTYVTHLTCELLRPPYYIT